MIPNTVGRWLLVTLAILGLTLAIPVVSAHGGTPVGVNETIDADHPAVDGADRGAWMDTQMRTDAVGTQGWHMGPPVGEMGQHMGQTAGEMAQHMGVDDHQFGDDRRAITDDHREHTDDRRGIDDRHERRTGGHRGC